MSDQATSTTMWIHNELSLHWCLCIWSMDPFCGGKLERFEKGVVITCCTFLTMDHLFSKCAKSLIAHRPCTANRACLRPSPQCAPVRRIPARTRTAPINWPQTTDSQKANEIKRNVRRQKLPLQIIISNAELFPALSASE